MTLYVCITLKHFNKDLKSIAFHRQKHFSKGSNYREYMWVWLVIPAKNIFLSRQDSPQKNIRITSHAICIYWSKYTLRIQKVFVQTSQGTLILSIFVILRSRITTKLKFVHQHWRNQRKQLGTHMITLQANPHPIKIELPIIGTYHRLRHRLIVSSISREN